MMPGDIPCERPCATRWCIYNQFSVCTDNATCGERLPMPEREDDDEKEDDDD